MGHFRSGRSEKTAKNGGNVFVSYKSMIAIWWFIAVIVAFVISATETGRAEHNGMEWDWVWIGRLAIVASVYTLLCLWGIFAEWLSKKQVALKDQEAQIRKTTWHYRFNQRMSGIPELWFPPETECEYWALTFQNLLSIGPLYYIVTVVVGTCTTLIRVVGWLIGLKPINFTDAFAREDVFGKNWEELADYGRVSRGYQRQWIGPVVGILLLVGLTIGIVAFLVQLLSAEVQVILALALGIWSGVLLASLPPTRRVILNFVRAVNTVPPGVASFVGGLFVYFAARLGGVCRHAHYVE